MDGAEQQELLKIGEALVALARGSKVENLESDSDRNGKSETTSNTDGNNSVGHTIGWIPDEVDNRDFTLNSESLKKLNSPKATLMAAALTKNNKTLKLKAAPPSKVDLRQFCSPIEDQGSIGSCTAQAVVGLIEYYARRRGEFDYEGSRLFLYKITRRLDHFTGDTGAHIRTTLRAATSIGVTPEKYWPYSDDSNLWDEIPDNFAYSLADNYKASSYFRFDPAGATGNTTTLLSTLKKSIASDMPFALGFTVYNSLWSAQAGSGDIPFPTNGENTAGGHAVMAVGYDNSKQITHPETGVKTTGAFLIRNSWGTGWGEAGYGWLPYKYITSGRARDFWSILDMQWLETQVFS